MALGTALGCVGLLGWSAGGTGLEDLYITEFVAQNTKGLTDEDGHYSDWIEIYNASTNRVNLAGWYLTDTAANLTRWRFPAVEIEPYGFLIVFASGKNRTDPTRPLHANFALAASGEYLALVAPDGTNVVWEYAPRFPPQKPDISYGLAMLPGPSMFLVDKGSSARFLVPASDIGYDWIELGFDDSAWPSSPTGIGFDGSTNYQSEIGTDIQAQMKDRNGSAFIRLPFVVPDPSQIQDLRLRLRYDDGFVAWLNGVEVARSNAPATLSWDSTATGFHGSEPGLTASLACDFDTNTPSYIARQEGASPGAAIQGPGTGSTGRFLRLIYDGVNNNVNSIAFDRVAAGVFPVVAAQFDFRLTDADNNPADGFFFALIPTSMYGNTGPGIVPIMQSGGWAEEPNYPSVFAVGFDVYPHSSQNDVSVHWNGVEYNNVTIPRSTLELVSGQFHRCNILVEYEPGGARVSVTITPNINTAPGSPMLVINRLFVPMPQYESRVQFGARTGGLNMALDLDNIKVDWVYPSGLVPAEEFNLTRHIPLLRPGTNVLAIQGLNVSATNADFLISPQLVARSVTLVTTTAVFLAETTPGAINLVGEEFFAPGPQFSIPAGVYPSNVVVELSSSVPGAVIHYTLNGLQPTEESPLYGGPITLTNSALVTARVWAPGYLPSRPVSQAYTLIESAVANFSSPLPIVILNTFDQVVRQDMEPRLTASIAIIDTPQPSGRATPLTRPDYHGRAGIEGRGQTAWSFQKKPMNVELRDDEDRDLAVSVLGMPAESDWILVNPFNDKTFLNDFLAYELFEKMGHYSVRRRFVEVFLNAGRTNIWEGGPVDTSGKVGMNDYVGIYLWVERIKVGPNRVNIAPLQPEDNAEPEITGGYIWKKDKASPNDVVFYTASGQDLRFHDPKPRDLTPAQQVWLQNHLNVFEAALYAPNWRTATGTNHYSYYIDVDSFVDQHWIVEFTKQIDGYRLSNYMHKDRNGKIKMEPIWDWNLSFGNANYLQGGTTNGWYWTNELEGISANLHIWLRQLITGSSSAFGTNGDPDFRQKITDRWGQLRSTVFHPSNLLARIDQLTNYIWEAQVRDFAKWPRLGRYDWPNPNGTGRNGTYPPPEGWHVDYQSPTTYSGIIEQLKKWIVGRYNWIDSQFRPAPTFSRLSGFPTAPLSMYAPTGTIYYTTDGSDPRLPGGGISPNARIYTGPISLPSNAQVVARVYAPGTSYMTPWTPWSPPTRANFGYPTPTLAITELMYHPAAPPPGGTQYDADEFEYIELANLGSTPIDLTGVRFVQGIQFTFPTGPMELIGAPTTNNFDQAGTSYTAVTLGSGPGATLIGGGPSGSFLRLATQNTGTNRNRVAFDQTAAGAYDHVVAEFDFRASNLSAPPITDAPTVQDFDNPGSTYYLRNFDTDTSTPTIMTDGPSGNYVRLTRTVGTELGGIYFDATAERTNTVVLVRFDFRCQGSADGFGFVFLNTANWGTAGTNNVPSFSEEANVAGSLGVGFDIYNNNAPPLEPNANHVSIHWAGVQVQNGVATPNLSLAAGVFHRAEILIKFETNRALVTVRITPDIYGAGGQPETLFNNFVISGAYPYRGRVAFCGRTGGAWANQDLDNIQVQYLAELPQPAGLSMQLLPVSIFGSSGQGSGLSHFTNEPAANGIFALDLSLHAAEFINDLSLYWNRVQCANRSLPSTTLDLDNGLFHRVRLELTRVTEGSLAALTLTPDVYGAGGPVLTVFTNLLVAGYYPTNCRVEFAARSGDQNLNVDLDNVSVRFEQFAPNWLAPGQRVLVVKNRAAFESRYGTGLPIAGEYTGNLDNAGERIVLVGRYGEPILDFAYSDQWLPMSDGNGFAMVPVNPSAPSPQWNDAAQWRLGSAEGGSPGSPEPTPPTFVPVVINEILAHADTNLAPGVMDAIELHNPSLTQPADISYWYLSDDLKTPKKYQIPYPTIIPPGGYVVFYASQFNAPGSGPRGFGLRAEGDDAYVFSADAAGNLTGYYHGFDFGATDPNETLGRYVDSQGDDQLVLQKARTLGGPNAGPLVGPVVISEVMYHPPDFGPGLDNQVHEFIELHNISSEPVLLGPHPTNTWRLRDAVQFDFPLGTVLPPGGYLLVVSFDPVRDTEALASFRVTYGLDETVPLYGPYEGKLDNSMDRVELTKPGQPDPDTGEAQNILRDKVKYHHDPPWPLAADGSGFSLHRLDVTAFGNDPINWRAGPPTPGRPYVPGSPPMIVRQPTNQVRFAFETAVFSVAAGGSGPYYYQWRFNNNNIFGATNATLVLSNLSLTNAGRYQVVVRNTDGAVESDVVTLTVYQSVTILAQPVTQIVSLGSNATFSVSAIGNGPVSYQWRRNGAVLEGQTNATLTITNAQESDDADYDCLLSDAVGTVQSAAARLIVLVRPTITLQPESQTVPVGSTVILRVEATGTKPLWYRWRKHAGTLVWPGEPTLILTNVTLADAATYDVIITNLANAIQGGFARSTNAYLTVVVPPTNAVVPEGGEITLRAVVSSPRTFTNTFTWLFNGVPILAGTNRATTSLTLFTNDLVLTNFTAAQAGTYTFFVTNTAGASAAFSATVSLFETNVPVSLAIELQQTNVVISWPNSPVSWTLEETTELGAAAQWQPTSATPVLQGDRWTVTVPVEPGTTKFFRLSRP